jgi:ferredoxin-NADP reductase/Na+-translocating ferredoxin:NAD+ oxidoreductase RnfD subunit
VEVNILRPIDDFLNGVTMYRLLAYGLGVIAAVGIVLAYLGDLTLPGTGLLLSVLVLMGAAYIASRLLAIITDAVPNKESWLITALILFCILPPATTVTRLSLLGLAAVIAMASKYILAYHHKHIFNPAAVAAAITSVTGVLPATWWVGSAVMLPFTLGLGLLVVRKIRRFQMVTTFVIVALITLVIVGLSNGQAPLEAWRLAIVSGPLIFFATIMLTEPATMPPRFNHQLLYATIIGVLFGAQLHIGSYFITPQSALLFGNVFAYLVSPKYQLRLRLEEKRVLSAKVTDFVFEPDRQPRFLPGQYLEWTLDLPQSDGRGNRRTFSLASSPTELDVHLGVKHYQPASAFKQRLSALQTGDVVIAGHLGGNFVMPKNKKQKLVFVAGGIGITPFRSMLKNLIDTHEQRDIVLLYIIADPTEISYQDVLAAAESTVGVRVLPILSGTEPPKDWQGASGLVDRSMLEKLVPDSRERVWMISGPNGLVQHVKDVLRAMGIRRRAIKTDFFSGY